MEQLDRQQIIDICYLVYFCWGDTFAVNIEEYEQVFCSQFEGITECWHLICHYLVMYNCNSMEFVVALSANGFCWASSCESFSTNAPLDGRSFNQCQSMIASCLLSSIGNPSFPFGNLQLLRRWCFFICRKFISAEISRDDSIVASEWSEWSCPNIMLLFDGN